MPRLSLAGIVAVLVMGTAHAQTYTIQLDGGLFKVAGWKAPLTAPTKGWTSVFAVYAGNGAVPPLLGSYAVDAGALVFHPRFPLMAGVHYRAVFRPPDGGTATEKAFDGPVRDMTRRTRVERVYPSADVWPANELRFYVYFSAAMSRGESPRRIHLLDARGNEVKGVFLPGEELWDPSFQRLTMTFDPGRIKRGLTSNQSMGMPISEGKQYRLVIDGDWPDARGVTMVEGFSKSFRGGAEERTTPDPKQWHVIAPKAGTAGALVVDFPRPMNYPLLSRMLRVLNASGSAVAGTVEVERQETRWRFTPNEAWKQGDYRLVVDTAIEDLAGNHIGQAFDVDVFERVTEHITAKTITLPFSVR